MISLLDRYIGRAVIRTTLMSLVVLIGLSTLIRFVEQIRSVGRGTYGLLDVFAFMLLSMPRDIEVFFPMATLLGGLIGMGILANNSELIVMMAAGRSKFNLSISVLKASSLMMIAILMLGEWGAPKFESQARQLRAQAVSGGALLSSPDGIWAKDGQSFIHIGELEETGVIQSLTVYDFEAEKLVRVVHGEKAVYQSDHWFLTQVEITHFEEQRIQKERLNQYDWYAGLTPNQLGVVMVRPESLSISGLYEYIAYLEKNQQNATRYELAFWRKIFSPLTVAVMLLVALSFIFGPMRSVTMGARVLLGVITGFVFHIINEVFGPLSQVYSVPPPLAALLPSLLFASAALYILFKPEN